MNMKVQLEVKEDKELRNYMKDYIKGIIDGAARDEITASLKVAIEKRLENISDIRLGNMLEVPPMEARKMIREALGDYTENQMAKIFERAVEQSDFDVRKYIRAIVKEEIGEVKKTLTNMFSTSLNE